MVIARVALNVERGTRYQFVAGQERDTSLVWRLTSN